MSYRQGSHNLFAQACPCRGEGVLEEMFKANCKSTGYTFSLIYIKFSFDFLILHKMHFQTILLNESHLISQAINNIRVRVALDIKPSPSARVCMSDTIRPLVSRVVNCTYNNRVCVDQT